MVVISRGEHPRIEIKFGKTKKFLHYFGRKIGFIKDDILWKTPLDKKRHIYRKWNSVGIEAELLSYLRKANINYVAVTFRDEQGWYRIPVMFWRDFGSDVTYGGRIQKHLSLDMIRRVAEIVYYEDHQKSKELKLSSFFSYNDN